MIALRKRFKAFGRGSLDFLQPENRKVLAFLRRYDEETILVVANLSKLAQQTKLDLSQFVGWRPVDLFGRIQFDPITDGKYYFTLGPHGFYWFSLEPQPAETLRVRALPSEEVGTVPTIAREKDELFERDNWFLLERTLRDYVRGRRWFRGKARDMRSADIKDVIPMRFGQSTTYVVLIQVEYTEGEPETYVVPLTTAVSDKAGELIKEYPHALVANLKPRNTDSQWILHDALIDKGFGKFLLQAIGRKRHFKGEIGEISASPTQIFRSARGSDEASLDPAPMNVEQSNTSVVYGDRLILKLFRRLEEGGLTPTPRNRAISHREDAV
jgi:maltose alpha-D-glucosyltransferase/alpha-amylase